MNCWPMGAWIIFYGSRENRLSRKRDLSDSDYFIYKWTEAVGFELGPSLDQPELRRTTDTMIRDVVAIQEPSGYLNTYSQRRQKAAANGVCHADDRLHELYCIGHMLQGAIAYYRATGDTTLLNAGIRFVDNFLIPNYGAAAPRRRSYRPSRD